MITIGEKLNSSIPKTLEAISAHDEVYLIEMIRLQAQCGADYLDLNTAVAGNEAADMEWLIGLVKDHCECGIMIDSQNPEVVRTALPLCTGRPVILNSVTPSPVFEPLFSYLAECGTGVVCMPAGEFGLTQSAEERTKTAQALCENLVLAGVRRENLYVDVMVEALATADQAAVTALATLRAVRARISGVHTVCGLSNISFGLPRRGLLNRAFLAMAMAEGLDSAILDVTSPSIRETLAACKSLLGQDEFCMGYIGFVRETAQ